MKRHPALNPLNACAVITFVSLSLGGILLACALVVIFNTAGSPEPQAASASLELAYSPEKETLVQEIVTRFNKAGFKAPSGKPISIQATKMDPADMVDAVRGGRFTAITPDSSLWLAQIDAGLDHPLVGDTVRYAVTPIVVAMWSDTAASLGYPKPISWQDLLARAKSNPSFHWSHPSTSTASGLLATLAEFYAGAGKTRGLSEADANNKTTLDYVASLEKTVQYYGEGEQSTIDQVLAKGRSYLDAFVVSERMVVYFNSKSQNKLVAIYPAEGTLWQDHPLALVEQPGLTDDQRLAFRRLRDFVLSTEVQQLVLQSGYRPVDLSLRLDKPPSPILTSNGVDPAQPQTTLQMPNAAVIQVVQSSWYLTKRPANIYLVVDTSGSMDDQNKLVQVKDALDTFLDQIQGDRDRVGMVPFATSVYGIVTPKEVGTQRAALKDKISGLSANGRTALYDGIANAYDDLQRRGEKDRINAIVVMTDGIENASSLSQAQLIQKVKSGNAAGVPVLIFCIAYGSDADLNVLTAVAEPTGGQARRADPDTIRRLYKILSTYF